MKQIKEYFEPTDVYIVGSMDFKDKTSFYITDDYCSMTVVGNKATRFLETDGGFTIFDSKQEIIDLLNSREETETLESVDYTVFTDFVGKIFISMLNEEGEDQMSAEVDLEKDLAYQLVDGYEEWAEPTITIEAIYSSGNTLPFINFLKENNFEVYE